MEQSELTFGKYRLIERLAYGGMAEVFLARSSGAAGFEKVVVIKRLHAHYSQDREFVSMLIDEAHLVSQLTHTNICQVFDLGEVDGLYYIALEYIDGRDLFSIMRTLRRTGRHLPIQAATYIINEVLEGLGYAHRKCGADGQPLNIVHRDISPQNVLATREGEVKIIDFGIAKARLRQTRTQAGILKGKYRYMAPEQAEGRHVDARSDLFAAGIVLYELCAGQVHGRGLSDIQLLERVRSASFEPLRTLRPDMPDALDAIVGTALQREPARRYQTAQDFQDALSGFVHGTGVEFGKRELGALVRELFPPDQPTDSSVASTPVSSRRQPPEGEARPSDATAGTGLEEAELLGDEELEELVDDVQGATTQGHTPRAGAAPRGATPAPAAPRAATPAPAPRAATPAPAAPRAATPAPAAPRAATPAPAPRAATPSPAPPRAAPSAPAAPGAAPPSAAAAPSRPRAGRARIPRPGERPRAAAPPADPATAPTVDRRAGPSAVRREDDLFVPPSYEPGLRAPPPEPFEAAPPAPATYGASAAPAGLTTSPERPRASSAPRRAPEPPMPLVPDVPDVAPRPGLSRGGMIAMTVTVLLLGGAAVYALMSYNPNQYQKRAAETSEASKGALYVTSKPAGADIVVDGKPTGRRTPDTVEGLPVRRALRLELRLAGYQPWSLDVTVTEDETTPVMAELMREAGAGRPKRGK